MSGNDAATTLIDFALGSAFVIYLWGWLGVCGVAAIIIYAWCSKPPEETTLLQEAKKGAESGCGIIVLVVMVLLLARLLGCK